MSSCRIFTTRSLLSSPCLNVSVPSIGMKSFPGVADCPLLRYATVIVPLWPRIRLTVSVTSPADSVIRYTPGFSSFELPHTSVPGSVSSS